MNDDIDLTQYPEAHSVRGPDGRMHSIMEPVYNLLAPCTFGDTWYDEEEIVSTQACPNDHMQPLNRAAAERVNRWRASLPLSGGQMMSIGDISEAAMALRNVSEERLQELGHGDYSKALFETAKALKAKRDPKGGYTVPDMRANAPGRANVPAMPNTRFLTNEPNGPGRAASVLHEPVRQAPQAQRQKPMTNTPGSARPGA